MFSAEVSHQTDGYNEMPSWDDETGFADYFGDENNGGDVDDSNALVSQPRQVCLLYSILVLFQLS